MSIILYDILPAKGHFHATLKMATLLKNSNHTVIYAVSYDFKNDIEKHGFVYSQQIPLPVSKEKNIEINKIGNKESILPNKWMKEFELLVLKIKPDIVLLDEQVAFKSIYYAVLKIPVILFQTKPDTRMIKGIPPFTSHYLPNKSNLLNNLFCKSLWKIRIVKVRKGLLLRLFLFTGKDPISICKIISNHYGINFDKLIELDRSFGIGIKGFPRFILSPKAFDFHHAEKEGVHRVGPLVNIKREGEINHPRYSALVEKIQIFKQKRKGKIIYCSMGTITGNDIKRCTIFFKRMIKVASYNPNDLIILSTGKHFDINKLLPLPENTLVFEQLPQIDLLQKCDIMITHGGMNSITECVFCGVPMLVYPLSRHWDQPGNSARVVYHGLGLRGRIEKDWARTISKKLNDLKLNYKFFKDKILAMKKQFENENNSIQVVDILESYIVKKYINNQSKFSL